MSDLKSTLTKCVLAVQKGFIKLDDFYAINIFEVIQLQGHYSEDKLSYYKKIGFNLEYDDEYKWWRGKNTDGDIVTLCL